MESMESVIEAVKDKPSVFTLVMTAEPMFMDRYIAIVIDRKGRKDIGNVVYKKLPGGGVKGLEPPEVAACHEIKEEIGLRGINPKERLLEIHKVSRQDRNSVHKDIFFVSDPVDEMRPLKPEKEEEIEYAEWEKASWVHEQIGNSKFIPNHAYAIIWFMVRDEFLRTQNTELIEIILRDRGLCHSHLEDKKLVLCFIRNCPECRNKPGIAALLKNDDTQKPSHMSIEGETYFVIMSGTFLDEYLLFQHGKRDGSYCLPRHFFEKRVSKEDVLEYAGKSFGGAFEWIAHVKTDRDSLVVLRNISHPSPELSPVPMNRAPSILFSVPFKDWQYLLAAFPILERCRYKMGDREFRPVVNHGWKTTWRDRVENSA